MDPPENSANRVGRTIWTVWGYLSGAVTRYLRPEVTDEGNQSVHARTDEIDLKSAVNKIDREGKTNKSDNENDRAEVKCSPSKVRVAASVQWENTGVVKIDNNDKLNVHTTKKQTYHCAAWSTGTDTDSKGRTAEKVSSDEVPAEEEHANCETEERETAQELEVTGKTEQNDGDNKEACDENREVEKCAEKREDADNTDIMIQSVQDVEQDKQISMMDHRQTEDTGGLKHPTDETEKQIIVQKNQGKTESDEDEGTESQVQDLLEYLTDEASRISKPERLKQIDKYFDEIADVSKNQIEEMILGTGRATEPEEESQTAQELEEIESFEQKDGDSEERDQDREVEKCDMMREDQGNTDVMIQSVQDVEQDKQISMMDHGQTEDTGGLKHPTDETEKQIIVQKNQRKTESDEDQGTESQVQDLLEYLTDEANRISKPERLKQIDKYSDEINEFSKNGLEEMILRTEQDEDTAEREQDMTKYELTESESEKHAPNDETVLKMTTAADETVHALEDTLLSDSEQHTSENIPESGTGSSVLATKTEGIFSGLTVCEFSGESRRGLETDWRCFEEIQTKLHDPQTPAEERAERDAERSEKAAETEHDTETLIQTDQTELSLKEHVEFRTETKIRSGDEEAEAFEIESRSPVIRNVTLQPHELLEFTEGQCKSSQGTMDTFSETQRNSSTSETTGTAEHVSTELLEEPLDLQGKSETDVAKTALEYVEEITNQVLEEMMETECNLVQKTEPLVGLSTEEPGDAEHQAPARCVSADASVLEEEPMLLAETMDSRVETASSEEHISSPECESTEADGRHEQMQKSIAGETVLRSHEDLMEVSRPGVKRGFDQVSEDLPEVKTKEKFDLILQAFEDSSLDFSVQKSRIAVKNPLIRPPTDIRKLLFRASAEPSDHSQTARVSAPSKGMIGFKLPGLGAGLPVLRKTEFGQKAEAERSLQTQQKSVAVTEDSVKQEQMPAKPKWTPPRHPGMGSPFMMAELKNKLKKPVQE